MTQYEDVKAGSKVLLKDATTFNGFDGPFTLPKRQYWIAGFWANACGLSTNRQDAKTGIPKYYIPSVGLRNFVGIY